MRRCLTRCDFKQKKARHKYIWPTHHFMIKSTPMNLDNVLVRINKLLFVAPSHISNIADIIHRTSSFWEKKNSSFESTFFSISSPLLRKLKFLRFFRLSCNDNNYMTYNWPNSAFFNFQEHAKQENCRQYLCILFFFFEKLELRTWRRQNSSLNRVFSQVGQ